MCIHMVPLPCFYHAICAVVGGEVGAASSLAPKIGPLGLSPKKVRIPLPQDPADPLGAFYMFSIDVFYDYYRIFLVCGARLCWNPPAGGCWCPRAEGPAGLWTAPCPCPWPILTVSPAAQQIGEDIAKETQKDWKGLRISVKLVVQNRQASLLGAHGQGWAVAVCLDVSPETGGRAHPAARDRVCLHLPAPAGSSALPP